MFKRSERINNHHQTEFVMTAPNLFLGKTQTQKDGTTLTITEFFSSQNITVQFADGYVKRNQSIPDFLSGNILHPGLQDNAVPFYAQHTKPAFTGPSGTTYYYIVCPTCKSRSIGTIKQLMEHSCFTERNHS